MLCCIVAESAHTHFDKLVDELHVVLLEMRVFCIYIRKAADTLMSALLAVAVVSDSLKTLCMEHLVTSAYCCIELIRNKVNIKCSVVRKNIHKNTDVIFLCRIKHSLHFCLCTENIVTYCPVCRLIVMVPVTFFCIKDLDVGSLRTEAGIHRRCLKHCVA